MGRCRYKPQILNAAEIMRLLALVLKCLAPVFIPDDVQPPQRGRARHPRGGALLSPRRAAPNSPTGSLTSSNAWPTYRLSFPALARQQMIYVGFIQCRASPTLLSTARTVVTFGSW